MQPKVSIVTPTLNRAEYLERLILNIKNQNYPNLEHIVQDSCSTDNTVEVLKKYEGSYNLRWFSEKDKGIADAYNRGFSKAAGDIFGWQDSDDLYTPDAIKKVMEVFERHPEVDFVFGDILFCNEHDQIIDYTKRPGFDQESLIYNGINISPQTAFWRRNLHEKLGKLNDNYRMCADYDFYIRAALAGAKFYHIPEFLAIYRVHSGQITKGIDFLLAEAKGIREKYYAPGTTPQKIAEIKKRVFWRKFWWFARHGEFLYLGRSLLRHAGILKAKV